MIKQLQVTRLTMMESLGISSRTYHNINTSDKEAMVMMKKGVILETVIKDVNIMGMVSQYDILKRNPTRKQELLRKGEIVSALFNDDFVMALIKPDSEKKK